MSTLSSCPHMNITRWRSTETNEFVNLFACVECDLRFVPISELAASQERISDLERELERLRDELSLATRQQVQEREAWRALCDALRTELAAHAFGVKVGLERAREICEDRATRLMQTAVHAASYGATQCTDAIQREIDKHA